MYYDLHHGSSQRAGADEAMEALAKFAPEWGDTIDETPALTAAPAAPPASRLPFYGKLAAGAWALLALGAPIALAGPAKVASLHPGLWLVALGVAILPAFMIVRAARALNAVRAERLERASASHFAARAMPGDPATGTALARVHTDVATLEAVVDRTLTRLSQIETVTQRQIVALETAVAAARTGAQSFNGALSREIQGFHALNAELHEQTDTLAQSVGRQVRLMREAARLFSGEVSGAEAMMQAQVGALSGLSETLAQRAIDFTGAAEQAKAASGELDLTLGKALDSLTQATSLTDASRQSIAAATETAQATAVALQDATGKAVADARRAAQMVRAEVTAMEDGAAAAVDRLTQAAQAAREAAAQAETAAELQAGAIKRRLGALAQTVQPIAEARANETLRPSFRGHADAGNVAPPVANDHATPALSAFDLVETTGLSLDDAFGPDALDRIARHAKLGAKARRQAVRDIAPDAVAQLGALLAANDDARRTADRFRRDPATGVEEARKRGRQSGDVTTAYLLIDAALG